MKLDINTLLPLLLGSRGGGYADILSMMAGNKKPEKPIVDVNKYFNPQGGPCPPTEGCEKKPDFTADLLRLLIERSLRPSPPPPKKPVEKPCGFKPIADFCGAETMLIMIRLIYG